MALLMALITDIESTITEGLGLKKRKSGILRVQRRRFRTHETTSENQ